MLHAYKPCIDLDGRTYTVIPSNEMHIIMGYNMVRAVDDVAQQDESRLQGSDPKKRAEDLHTQLQKLQRTVIDNTEIKESTKQEVSDMIMHRYANSWKTKYDLQKPASFPPMEIRLKPDAVPSKIKRHYRWTREQRAFLRALLKKLVDVGVISRTDSEWCCPVVLVIKPDGHWRLCVDPTQLNKATVPMVWEVPKVREIIQENLAGMAEVDVQV